MVRRVTQQKNAIRNVLLKSRRPLSVNEVLELAKNIVPGLGIATVYRTLKSLQVDGLVIQVGLLGQPPRWEISPKNHHHHFLCRTCGRLFEINSCVEDLMRLLPKGYILEEHDILLTGICNDCNGKTSREAVKNL